MGLSGQERNPRESCQWTFGLSIPGLGVLDKLRRRPRTTPEDHDFMNRVIYEEEEAHGRSGLDGWGGVTM